MQIKVDTRELQALIPRIGKFRASVVPIVAGVLVKQVKTLSQQQQVSFDGSAFAPLTPAYKRRKRHAGHLGIPNFTYSGKYMNRIGLRLDGAVPYVGPVESFQPQAQGLDKKRKIWGVHPDSVRLSISALEQAWKGMVAR